MFSTMKFEKVWLTRKNFRGLQTTYTPAGDRYFSILLDKKLADELRLAKWAVAGQGSGFQFLKIKLPKDYPLELGKLDDLEFVHADIVIEGVPWSVQGRSGVVAFLISLEVVDPAVDFTLPKE